MAHNNKTDIPLASIETKDYCADKTCKGACCNPLIISYFLNEQLSWELLRDEKALKNSIQVFEEGIDDTITNSNGSLVLQGLLYENRKGVFTVHALYYCDRYDKKTGMCTDYSNRFSYCRKYSCYESTVPSKNSKEKLTIEDKINTYKTLRMQIEEGTLPKTPEQALMEYLGDLSN